MKKTLFLALFVAITFSSAFSQTGGLSPTSVEADDKKGPTLVICSNVNDDYIGSKTRTFEIPNDYVMLKLDYKSNQFLNTTLNAHITQYNFRKVIILA